MNIQDYIEKLKKYPKDTEVLNSHWKLEDGGVSIGFSKDINFDLYLRKTLYIEGIPKK